MYVHRYVKEDEYEVVEYYNQGFRVIPLTQHDYLDWLSKGGIPSVEVASLYLKVENGVVVVDVDKKLLLEGLEKKAAEDRERLSLEKSEVVDNLFKSRENLEKRINDLKDIGEIKEFLLDLVKSVNWIIESKV